MDITNLVFYLGRDNFIYSGEPNEPEVEIKNGYLYLTKNVDYTVKYENNINAGTGLAIVTGIDEYEGTKTLEFNIESLSIYTALIECGEPNELGCYDINNLAISIGNLEMVEGRDYIKEIEERRDEDNTDYIISDIIFTGIGNFTDVTSASFYTGYTGIKKDINSLNVIIDDNRVFDYTGTEKIIKNISISDGEYILVENTDYEITYIDNINAGTGKLLISGIGEIYYGTIEVELTINPISIENGALSCGANDEEGFYNTDNVTLSVNYRILEEGIDFEYNVETEIEDKYIYSIITVTGIGNYFGTISGRFITGRNYNDITLADITLSQYSFGYTGSTLLPEVVTDLELDVDYIVEFPESSINSGTYTITITGIGDYTGTKTLQYSINDLDISDAIISFGEPNDAGFYEISNMVVTVGDLVLTEFQDYKYRVTQKEIDSGFVESTCILTGINNFSGTKSVSIITSRKEKYAGKVVELSQATIYPRYGTEKSNIVKSGTFYLWDGNVKNQRIRITNNIDNIKKLGFVTGWVDIKDIEPEEGLKVGDMVLVNGSLNTYADGLGNTIIKNNAIMYITDKLDPLQFEYNYGVATDLNRTRQGWVKEESIKKYER